jgi:Kelch motif
MSGARAIRVVLVAGIGLLALAALAGAGPELPGPPIREWLGIAGDKLPTACEPDPARVRTFGPAPTSAEWRREPRSPFNSPEAGGVSLAGSVYMVGGQDREGTSAALWRFDEGGGGRYVREPDAPVAIDHPVFAVHRDDLILASGYVDGTDATNRAWSYSTRTRRWRELPAMRVARGAAGGGVIGDRLYVVGGAPVFGDEAEPHASLEIYDFDAGRWLPGPDMPTARHHFAAAVAGGRLYVAGGRTAGDLSLDAFEQFDPATGRWSLLPPLPHGLGASALTAVNGRLVLTGGGDDTNWREGGGWTTAAVFAYDARAARWERLPDLRHPRHAHVAAALGDRLFVFRGSPCPGYGLTSEAESLLVR